MITVRYFLDSGIPSVETISWVKSEGQSIHPDKLTTIAGASYFLASGQNLLAADATPGGVPYYDRDVVVASAANISEPMAESDPPPEWFTALVNELAEQQQLRAAAARIPAEVTMRQARLALHHAGLLAIVQQHIAAMTGESATTIQIEWEYASTIKRNSTLVTELASQLQLTPTALDELFITASQL